MELRPRTPALMLAAALLLLPGRLIAQAAADTTAEVDTTGVAPITAATIARHAAVLAHDSFSGRDTPSPALTRAAQYVAAQFQQFGLTPGGATEQDEPAWLDYYPVPGHLGFDEARWTLNFRFGRDRDDQGGWVPPGPTDTTTVAFTDAAYFAVPLVSQYPQIVDDESRGTWLVSGYHTAASLAALALSGQTVLYVPPADVDSAARRQLIDQLYTRSYGVVVVDAVDSGTFARAHAAARAHPPFVADLYLQNALRPHGWVVHASAGTPTALLALLERAGVDIARLAADRTPVARSLPLRVNLQARPVPRSELRSEVLRAPNVIGRLEGRDSVLRQQYVLFLAHLDEVGGRPLLSDSVGRGPRGPSGDHDNRAGVAALLALAEAFSRPDARPRRSLLFLATSGGAKPEFWGTAFAAMRLPGPIVSVLNVDALGEVGGDSVVVAGLHEADSVPSADWIAATHPELELRVVDGGSGFAPEADHFGLRSLWAPLLYFHTGRHGSSATGPRPAPVNTLQTARVGRLVFYMGRELADAAPRPRLNAVGRRHYLASGDQQE